MKMSKKQPLEEKLLRFAEPELYKMMVEIFSNFNIHSYDIHATVSKNKKGYDLTLRFSNSFAHSVNTTISHEQASNPDEDITRFFEQTAKKCKDQLISDYYKMIKP
jgi:hypothetical protein